MIAHSDIERLNRRQRALARAVAYFLCAAGICLMFAAVCWGPAGHENGAFADLHAHLDAQSHLGAVGAPSVEKSPPLTLARFLTGFGLPVLALLAWLLHRRWFCFAALCFGLFLVTWFAGHVDKRATYFAIAYGGSPEALVAASDGALGPDVRSSAGLRAVARYVAAQRAYLDGDARGVHHWLSQAPFDAIPFSDAMPWRFMAMREYAHAHGFSFADDDRLNRELFWSRPSIMRIAALYSLVAAFLLTFLAFLCSLASAKLGERVRRIMQHLAPLAEAPA